MEHVCRRLGIVQEDLFGVALAYHAVGEAVFLLGMSLGKCVAHIAKDGLVILGAPHLEGDAGDIRMVRVFIVCVVFSASRQAGHHRRQSKAQSE